MPTILRVGPYRFFFYSGDGVELAWSITPQFLVRGPIF